MLSYRCTTALRPLTSSLAIAWVSTVPELIRSFDIMVMPSVYESETFGVAAIEASAAGVPIITSRAGGLPEAVADNVSGLLIPPGDVAALTQALQQL